MNRMEGQAQALSYFAARASCKKCGQFRAQVPNCDEKTLRCPLCGRSIPILYIGRASTLFDWVQIETKTGLPKKHWSRANREKRAARRTAAIRVGKVRACRKVAR